MILRLSSVVVSTLLLLSSLPALAEEKTPHAFDIGAQSLATALSEFARQSQQQLLFAPDLVAEKTTQGVKGTLAPTLALSALLRDTGLTFTTTANGAILIGEPRASAAEDGGLRVAQAEGAAAAGGGTESQQPKAEESEGSAALGELEEIVVTAQKRVERLQDVPVPVTVLNAQALTENNQLRVQDYYNRIPGFSLVMSGNGSTPVVAIRGVTTGGDTNPTVGIVVDEISYGASANTGQSTPAVADIDPGDLQRVEVLRGPQGTLYGAASIGGLLKFVTVDPSTDRLYGRVQVGATSVSRSSDTGYSVRGNVNVPLSDTFAVRASGFTLRDPGYIDNAESGERDTNRRDSEGGRLSALWRPSEAFSLKLSALIQNTERLGPEDVDPTLGTNPQQSFLTGSGFSDRNTEAYSATMTGRLGPVEIVSATGYSIDEGDDGIDFTTAFGTFMQDLALLHFGVDREVTVQHSEVKKFTQEVRASLPIGEKVDWLIGAFYTEEDTFRTNDNQAADSTGQLVGSIWGTVYDPAEFTERAVFSTLTYQFTDRLDVQVGGRYSENEQDYTSLVSGPRFGGVFSDDRYKSDGDAFTYLVTPRFKMSADLMAYARLATGYRPGGPNIGCNLNALVPCKFGPDKTKNYDLGLKGVLNSMLNFDVALYYIDWQDIQISPLFIIDPVFGFLQHVDNVSSAESKGIELAVEARPIRRLTLAAWAAYNDAELTAGFPPESLTTVGSSGDRLPYSPRFSGNVSVDQDFPLASGATVFVGGTVGYVGDRRGNFKGATVPREVLPSYTQVDLRAGFRYDTWSLNLFANNVTDKRGILRSGADASLFNYITYIQPRTIGLSLAKTFE